VKSLNITATEVGLFTTCSSNKSTIDLFFPTDKPKAVESFPGDTHFDHAINCSTSTVVKKGSSLILACGFSIMPLSKTSKKRH